MRVCAVICEYNPFHLGHAYHLRAAREASGADYVLCLMSGALTQRGAFARHDKWLRARAALENGAALVLELPTRFACAPAEIPLVEEMLRLQGFRHLRKELIPDGTMHHQRLTGIADTDPLGLGIHQYFYRHIHIRILVHIDVAVAGSGLYDGDRAVLHHAADQSRTASWEQHIHKFLQLHKLRSDRTIRIFDQLYGSPGHTAGFQCIL